MKSIYVAILGVLAGWCGGIFLMLFLQEEHDRKLGTR